MRIKNIFIILFIFLIVNSCVEEYWPDVDKYQNLLVVDAFLTDNSDQVFVKLSISSPVYNDTLITLSNAEVHFTDEDEVSTFLHETEVGVYLPIDSNFKGNIGSSYQLHIKLANGNNYISDVCKLTIPSPIDSVYGIIEFPDFAINDHEFPGIQFNVENHSTVYDTSYYLWKMYQTYKFRSSFNIDYTWEGELIKNQDPTALRTCWRTSRVKNFVVSSTKNLAQNATKDFSLNFVATNTKALSIRYSLLVRQFTISKSAFIFYDAIDQQNSEQGNMWSKQPVQILGNMHNTDNSEESVLGYFIVAGMSEKRIFVDSPQIPFYYHECIPNDEVMRFIQFEPPNSWPIYIARMNNGSYVGASSRSCFDCRLSDGSLTPPSYWED